MSSMDSHHRFFRVILKEMLRDDKISLPEKTVRTFGVKIPNRVVFKLRDSVEWQIEVIKSKEMVWFRRGWREFAEYYGLDHGSLLTFKFDGESTFKVCIFDKTTTEIDYPCAAQKTSTNTEFKEKDSIKIERDLLVEMRGKASISDPRPLKKVKLEDPCTGAAEFRDTHIVSDDEEDGDEAGAEVIPISEWMKSISATRKIQALERTSSFKSANPFFRVVMQPSYISSFYMHVPCKFARNYFRMKQGHGTFTVENGGTWHASYVPQEPHDLPRFVSGWREFVLDNHLKVGDVCIFELIKARQLSFKVSIFPAEDCQDPSPSCQGLEKRSCRPPSRVVDKNRFEPETEAHTRGVAPREDNPNCHGSARERAFKFASRNPFFVASVSLSHITGSCLFLPNSFRRTHLKGVNLEHLQDIVLRTPDGNKWSARLHLNKRNQYFQVRIGWYKFIRDNSLKKGDFCVFELILDFQIIFNVHIFRAFASGPENSRHHRGGPKSWPNPRKHVTQNPFFEICICTSTIQQASLYIPSKFSNKYLASNEVEKVTLKVGDRRWVLRVKKYNNAVKLIGGWRSFARDNALQPKDVCIFELVGDTCEFQVSILRSYL